MSYTTERDSIEAERNQNETAIKVIAEIQTINSNLNNSLMAITRLIAGCDFDLIHADIVTPAVAAITAANALKAALEDEAIQELLNYNPKGTR